MNILSIKINKINDEIFIEFNIQTTIYATTKSNYNLILPINLKENILKNIYLDSGLLENFTLACKYYINLPHLHVTYKEILHYIDQKSLQAAFEYEQKIYKNTDFQNNIITYKVIACAANSIIMV